MSNFLVCYLFCFCIFVRSKSGQPIYDSKYNIASFDTWLLNGVIPSWQDITIEHSFIPSVLDIDAIKHEIMCCRYVGKLHWNSSWDLSPMTVVMLAYLYMYVFCPLYRVCRMWCVIPYATHLLPFSSTTSSKLLCCSRKTQLQTRHERSLQVCAYSQYRELETLSCN